MRIEPPITLFHHPLSYIQGNITYSLTLVEYLSYSYRVYSYRIGVNSMYYLLYTKLTIISAALPQWVGWGTQRSQRAGGVWKREVPCLRHFLQLFSPGCLGWDALWFLLAAGAVRPTGLGRCLVALVFRPSGWVGRIISTTGSSYGPDFIPFATPGTLTRSRSPCRSSCLRTPAGFHPLRPSGLLATLYTAKPRGIRRFP